MFTLSKAIRSSAGALLLVLTSQAVSYGQPGGPGEMQTWLDETLKHKIEAKFRGMEGDFVKLETADGQVKKIPYAKLSLSSQLKARKIADPRSFDAPPLPSAYTPPPVPDSPFSPDDTIEKHFETLVSQLKAGHADVAWHALPPSARADIETCIVRVAEILGPNTFKQMQAVLPNLHTIVRDKRSFIVGSQSISSQPQIAKLVNQGLPAIEPLVGVLTKPSTWNSENFKEGKVGPWIMLFANDALAATKSLNAFLKPLVPNAGDLDLSNVSFKVLEKTADSAKVEVTNGANKQVLSYKKVDGYWMEEKDQTLAKIAELKAYLESLDQAGREQMKQQVRQGLTFANSALGALAKAKTQQEFNQLFDPIAGEFMRGLQQGLAGQGLAGRPGAGGPMNMSGMSNSGGMANSGGGMSSADMSNSGGMANSGMANSGMANSGGGP